MNRAVVAGLLAVLTLFSARTVAADASPRRALFALIVGVNQSVDRELAVLEYADDDAASYLDLYRLLGARTYLLTRVDDSTRRLHPQAAAEALPPRRSELENAARQLALDVARAHAQGIRTVVYFVYAGHGNVSAGEGYVTLEDARLSGRYLEALIRGAGADEAHAIVDACYSFFLTFSRGPGGTHRPVSHFADLDGLGSGGSVGLLLSTSSARESHEWQAFQGGVFSHEVRSGLYGAADANGDGNISYREIAAFVERANAQVANARFRPDVFARAPRSGDSLMDISGVQRRLELDGDAHGHYFLEDAVGNRLADLHLGVRPNTPNISKPRAMQLLRPTGPLYLRAVGGGTEYEIPNGDMLVSLAALAPRTSEERSRGAELAAFGQLFSLPFDQVDVDQYRFRVAASPSSAPRLRRGFGWAALGFAVAALSGAIALSVHSAALAGGPLPMNQASAAQLNTSLEGQYAGSGVLYGLTGAAVLTGAVLLSQRRRPLSQPLSQPLRQPLTSPTPQISF